MKKVSDLIYGETNVVWKDFPDNLISDSSEHTKRKTVTAMDVVYGLKGQGYTLYGFGG